MCYCCEKTKKTKVHNVYNLNGEISYDEFATLDLPKHVNNAFLNRNVQKDILGFRYETKTDKWIVYSSVEAKTFCMIMQISAMHK